VSTPLVARAVSSVRCAAVVVSTLVGALLAGAVPGRARAQTTPIVSVTCPICETGTSVTPSFVVLATDFSTIGPLRYTVQVSTNNRFDGTLELDTTFSQTATAVSVAPRHALQAQIPLFYRATVTDADGRTAQSSVVGPFVPPNWVTLVSPPQVAGRPERTLQPRFVWRSPSVNEPPGPWQYTVTIRNRNGRADVTPVGSDTTFTPGPTALEANAAYTWSVEARLPRSDRPQATVVQQSVTFTTEDTTLAVTSTQLNAPFPNPFPYVIGSEVIRGFTCIWFDLKTAGTVELEVLDLRGAHVRRLVPNAELTGRLDAGRHGRGRPGTNEACDARTAWDGRDDRGNDVPEGVYIIRFRADGISKMRKVTFRGR
jgi:hypothetical protein